MAKKRIEFDESEFKRLFAYGMSYEEIGQWYGASQFWARSIAKKVGLYKPQKSTKLVLDKEKLREMTEKGMDVIEIAEAFGVGVSTVYKRLKEYGIKRKKEPVKAKEKKARRFMPNNTQEIIDDGVRRLVEKRRKAVQHFLETGKMDKALEYVNKYKVPVSRNEKDFRIHLQKMAVSMNLLIKGRRKVMVKA